MNDSRFDNLTRAIARGGSSRLSRRTVLGVGAPLAVAAGLGVSRNSAAQDGTPAAPGPLIQRHPGGPSIADKAFDLEYDLDPDLPFCCR